MITIALPTGRVLIEALDVLSRLDLPVSLLKSRGRELVIEDGPYRYILAKPMDVPLHVTYGAADLALVGSDVMWEMNAPLIELADTGRGKCRIVIAGPERMAKRFLGHESELMWLRIATKYPNIADRYFSSRGVQVEIIHMHGSIELAPMLGLSDCILDIVQTGSTLKANHLKIFENVTPVSLRLAGSVKSVQTKWEEISIILNKMESLRV
ncbi:MAG TPA: ATP phosphoribosyltransferase [Synergistales bacterium]|nr:ATP phosphoribosyltransferase [Synergistales bacterium]